MKSIIPLLFAFTSFQLVAQHSINVKIGGIQKVEGAIEICLFDNAANFMEDPVQCTWVQVNDHTIHYTFDSLRAGDYAVVIYQDFNDNQDLDTNWMGIPKEPYGFSNNPKTTFGPPSFEDSMFAVHGKKDIEISLK